MRKQPERYVKKQNGVTALQFDGTNADDVIAMLPAGSAWKSGAAIQVHLDHDRFGSSDAIGRTALIQLGNWAIFDGIQTTVLTDEQFKARYTK